MQKISFMPMNKFTEVVLDAPKPSAQSIPEWYKKIPLMVEGYDEIGLHDFNSKASSLTIKGCTPFLDALTAGYMVTLPSDLEVKKTEDGELLGWITHDMRGRTRHYRGRSLSMDGFGGNTQEEAWKR